MSLGRPTISRPLLTVIQLCGGVLYVTSFFLTAVYPPPDQGTSSGPINGIVCAVWSLIVLYGSIVGLGKTDPGRVTQNIGFLFAGLGGLINPLLITYLVSPRSWRRYIAIIIVADILLTCVSLALIKFTPSSGFFLWVFGTLLILSPEIAAAPEATQ